MRSLINKVTARLSAKTPARRAPRLDPRPLSRPATGQVTRQATRQSSRPAEGSGTKRPLRDLETTALLARRLPEDRVLPRPIRKAVSSRRMLLLAIAIAAPYLAMRGMAMAEGALDASRQTADQQLVAGEARETGFWAWLSSTGDVARQAIPTAADTGLVVNHITVTGRDRTTPSELLSALGTKRGAPILKVDPQDARARLMDLPWIAEATVERRLPDRIHVALVERQPLALWRHDGQFTVIDRQGDPIAVDPALFADLIILVGAKAPMEAEDLLATLGEIPEIAERVKAASLV
ncbi:MAG: cell division protein FtsQ/DivIB, partial [Rhodospirillaceae bacterium]